MNFDTSHLHTLARLEPGNNINDIHRYLCATEREDMIGVSRSVVDLYKIAESEREFFFRRNQHGLFDDEYGDRAGYKKCFFINRRKAPEANKVELEYFLDLLYSISFSLYLGTQKFFSFNRDFNSVPKRAHLLLLESFLECVENLYTSIDTLAVLIVLVCGIGKRGIFSKGKIDPHSEKIVFSNLAEWLGQSPFTDNFRFPAEDNTFRLFKALRNNRAHRPFLDWSYNLKIADSPANLMKVRSIAENTQLYKIYVPLFLADACDLTSTILLAGLEGAFQTYKERHDYEMKHPKLMDRLQEIHDGWSQLLA